MHRCVVVKPWALLLASLLAAACSPPDPVLTSCSEDAYADVIGSGSLRRQLRPGRSQDEWDLTYQNMKAFQDSLKQIRIPADCDRLRAVHAQLRKGTDEVLRALKVGRAAMASAPDASASPSEINAYMQDMQWAGETANRGFDRIETALRTLDR